MAGQQKDLDFVIFGATGFTGKLVVEEFYRAAQHYQNSSQNPNAPKFTWAIAGRSETKLFEMANIISITTSSSSVRQPEMIIADITRPETLNVMAKRAKVLLACVGPFRLYGEPVVKACLENHTDYVDITGETEFIEQIQIKYHELAKTSNVTIIPACGFDCLPADYGLLYTKQQLKELRALPSSIELFYKTNVGPSGFTLHYATYESAILAIQNIDNIRKLRTSVNRPRVPKIGPELKKIPNGRWEKRVAGYVTPFFFADPAVIRLSQQLDIENESDVPPVQFAAYLVIPKLMYLIEMLVCYKILSFLAHYSWGRWLILKFPRLFTLGTFSHEGPTLEQIQQTKFEISFYARGYSQELIDTVIEAETSSTVLMSAETTPLIQDNQNSRPVSSSTLSAMRLNKIKPDVEIITQVAGPEPAYSTTTISIVQCAFTLSLEKAKIPAGVLTPSVAFGKTELLQRLKENGLNFRIVGR